MTQTIEHQEREHSEHGFSGLHRWSNCAASVLASRGVQRKSSPAARLGTAAHEIAEECLRDGFDALDFSGIAKTIEGEVIPVDDETLEDIQVYLDDCRALTAEADDMEVFVEVRFDLTALNPPAPVFGTADYVAYSRKLQTLWVKDYKNGWLNVPATSGQPKGYAVGATVFLGPDRPVQRIVCTIVQPNSGGVKTIEYTPRELATWWHETVQKIKATLDPNAAFTPGDWCEFCPVAGRCKARAEAELAKVAADFQKLMAGEMPPEMEMRLMSPAEMGQFLAYSVSLKDTASAIQKEVFRLEATGTDVPGWKLVDKRALRKFVGGDEAVADKLAALSISPWAEPDLITVAEAERRLVDTGAVGEHKTKKAAKEAAAALLAPFTDKKSSGVTLAPDADPRPAVQAGDEFGEVPDDL